MSVRDLKKVIVVSDCLTGSVIANIPYDDYYTRNTIMYMLDDIIAEYCYHNGCVHGFL